MRNAWRRVNLIDVLTIPLRGTLNLADDSILEPYFTAKIKTNPKLLSGRHLLFSFGTLQINVTEGQFHQKICCHSYSILIVFDVSLLIVDAPIHCI